MLSPQQIRQYQKDGFVLAPGIFCDDQLDAMERDFDWIIQRRLAARTEDNMDITWAGDWKKDQPDDSVVFDCHDVQAYSAAWSRALTHPRLTDAFSDCLDSPNVQLHHTKLFQKPASRGGGFPMHQDAPYFPHQNHSMMAGIVHLSDTTDEMGCFRIIPGSHKLGLLPVFNEQAHYLDPQQYPVADGQPCTAKRGDVLFFNYLAIHGSGPNLSAHTRKTVLIQVRDPEDPAMDDSHQQSHAQGLMLRGINPCLGNVPMTTQG